MKKILLNNRGRASAGHDLYFPRLMVNGRGEIILATSRSDKYNLTRGILVAKTPESKSTAPIGQKIDDWEVCGELEDYNGTVKIAFKNEVEVTYAG